MRGLRIVIRGPRNAQKGDLDSRQCRRAGPVARAPVNIRCKRWGVATCAARLRALFHF